MNKIISSRGARRALAAAAALLVGGWIAAGSAIPASAAPAAVTAGAVAPSTTGGPLGPNVYVFTPSMSQASIQSTLDSIASQQVSNQFGRSTTPCSSSPAPTDRPRTRSSSPSLAWASSPAQYVLTARWSIYCDPVLRQQQLHPGVSI